MMQKSLSSATTRTRAGSSGSERTQARTAPLARCLAREITTEQASHSKRAHTPSVSSCMLPRLLEHSVCAVALRLNVEVLLLAMLVDLESTRTVIADANCAHVSKLPTALC